MDAISKPCKNAHTHLNNVWDPWIWTNHIQVSNHTKSNERVHKTKTSEWFGVNSDTHSVTNLGSEPDPWLLWVIAIIVLAWSSRLSSLPWLWFSYNCEWGFQNMQWLHKWASQMIMDWQFWKLPANTHTLSQGYGIRTILSTLTSSELTHELFCSGGQLSPTSHRFHGSMSHSPRQQEYYMRDWPTWVVANTEVPKDDTKSGRQLTSLEQ